MVRLLLMPAYSEASGFKPTERISKPNVVFFIKNHVNTKKINAKKIPIFKREPSDKFRKNSVCKVAFCPTNLVLPVLLIKSLSITWVTI